jgi:hypothetical protein
MRLPLASYREEVDRLHVHRHLDGAPAGGLVERDLAGRRVDPLATRVPFWLHELGDGELVLDCDPIDIAVARRIVESNR